MQMENSDESVALLVLACYKLTGPWMEGKGVRAVDPESLVEGFVIFAILIVIAK